MPRGDKATKSQQIDHVFTSLILIGNITGCETALKTADLDVHGDCLFRSDICAQQVFASNLCGNIIGNVIGDLIGNVIGDVCGNIQTDFITEKTAGNGINIDGVVIKDSNVIGDIISSGNSIFSGIVDFTLANVLGLVADAENVGTGAEVFKGRDNGNLEFRTLLSGTNLTITQNTDELLIELNGNITANVSGNLTGNVVGDLTGNTFGIHCGNVLADFIFEKTAGSGVNIDGVLLKDGSIFGNIAGNLVGNLTGPVVCATSYVSTDTIVEKTPDAGVTVEGVISKDTNLIVPGNLLVSGTTFFVDTETVIANSHLIIINNGEVGPGVTEGFAGIQIDRGTATDYRFVFNEAKDCFETGIIGDLQCVATREDSPVDTGIAFWNDTEKRFDTSTSLKFDGSDLLGNVKGNLTGDVVGDICGNVKGDITGNLTGDVIGNIAGPIICATTEIQTDLIVEKTPGAGVSISGNLKANIIGNLVGDVVGDIIGNLNGDVVGNVTGNLTGDVCGNLKGNVAGDIIGNVNGNLTGDVTGNVNGDLVGNVNGDLVGNVIGNLTGDVSGNVNGNVNGDVIGNVTGNLTGDVVGNVNGNVNGDLIGNVNGNLTGNVVGDICGNVYAPFLIEKNPMQGIIIIGNINGDLCGNIYSNFLFPKDTGMPILLDGVTFTSGTMIGNVDAKQLKGDIIIGNVLGNLTGDVVGNLTGPVVCATTHVSTDTIIEKTGGSGVTIDGVLLKDSSITGDLTGNISALNQKKYVDGSFTEIFTTTTVYRKMTEFIFEGTNCLGNILGMNVVTRKNAGPTSYDVRVFDFTNVKVIAELLGSTNTVYEIKDMGTLGNLSAGIALWELQMRRNAPGGGRVFISAYSVEHNDLTI